MAERPTEIMDRLLGWKGRHQYDSQSLATKIMDAEGYSDIRPIHPLGGRDRGKDAIMRRDGLLWIMAAWFPEGQQNFAEIKRKLTRDSKGVANNNADGLVFVTNQRISESERIDLHREVQVRMKIYDLVTIADILDRPRNLRIAQKYLHIGPPPEELAMINRTQNLSNQLLEFEERMRQVSATFFPDRQWMTESESLAYRITRAWDSDMRAADRLLAEAVMNIADKWSGLQRIFSMRRLPPDWIEDDQERLLLPIKQFRYANNAGEFARYARSRIIEVTNEPWRLGGDETELFEPQIWDEDELPSVLRDDDGTD